MNGILLASFALFAAIDGARDFDHTAARAAAEMTLAELAEEVLFRGETPHVALPEKVLDDPSSYRPNTPIGKEFAAACRKDFATRYARQAEQVLTKLAHPQSLSEVFPSNFLQQVGTLPEAALEKATKTFTENVAQDVERQKKHQLEILKRARVSGYAPEVVREQLRAYLVNRVTEERKRAKRGSWVYGVFPSVTNAPLEMAVSRTVLGRVTECLAEATTKADDNFWRNAIEQDRVAHACEDDSLKLFTPIFSSRLREDAICRAEAKSPVSERETFKQYVAMRAEKDEEIAKRIRPRVNGELKPTLVRVRKNISDSEYPKAYPNLAKDDWRPDANEADDVCTRSDFTRAVRQRMPEPASPVLKETKVRASERFLSIYEKARTARTGQLSLVDSKGRELEKMYISARKETGTKPEVREVARKLRAAVIEAWQKMPPETVSGWQELFPSVERRIEEKARAIAAAVADEKPIDPEEQKPPETPPIKPLEIVPIALDIGYNNKGEITISAMSDQAKIGTWSVPSERKQYRDSFNRVRVELRKGMKAFLKRLSSGSVIEVAITVRDGFVYCGTMKAVSTVVSDAAMEVSIPVTGSSEVFAW